MSKIYDRKQKKEYSEIIAAGNMLEYLYTTSLGTLTTNLLIKRKFVSDLYGWFADTSMSKKVAYNLIDSLDIDMSLYEQDFNTLNEFFYRKRLHIEGEGKEKVVSPCHSYLTAFTNIDDNQTIKTKDCECSIAELVGQDKDFSGATVLRFRLAPNQYHRVHMIDDAKLISKEDIKGSLYSVSPVALENMKDIYLRNKRRVYKFNTENFGQVYLVAIGATMVGSIVDDLKQGDTLKKLEELSYFKFGGSMMIAVFEKGKVSIDEDILKCSKENTEVLVDVGESIGNIGGGDNYSK